jgi:hypothetical protein
MMVLDILFLVAASSVVLVAFIAVAVVGNLLAHLIDPGV